MPTTPRSYQQLQSGGTKSKLTTGWCGAKLGLVCAVIPRLSRFPSGRSGAVRSMSGSAGRVEQVDQAGLVVNQQGFEEISPMYSPRPG
jgi:hypothetical protein